MRRLRLCDVTPEVYPSLLARPGECAAGASGADAICLDVKRAGDDAVRRYTLQYDKVLLDRFAVPESAMDEAERSLPPGLRTAIEVAIGTIQAFHAAQNRTEEPVETLPGVLCWRERRPIERVGLYVPAGSAPLPSTVLMLGIPARIAGCPEIVLCSPPRPDGSVDPVVLAAARMVGISRVFAIGGVQAIAAMAYGTASVPKVDKIFGPGNRYVTAAKRIVASDPGGAAIDLLAGPSELLIIADGSASAPLVAADLLSQAEHDPDAQVSLVTTSASLAAAVLREIEEQVKELPRREIIWRALDGGLLLEAGSLDEAVRFSNDYAPEHLMLTTADPMELVGRIRHAGSVFLGPYAPVTAGDYASGTNHTLPTGRTARVSSGVSVESFQKMVLFQSIDRGGLDRLAPTLVALAETEGLEAHKRAVLARRPL